MKRPAFIGSLMLLWLALAGFESCGEPKRSKPTRNYIVVPNILSPVAVRGSNLRGAGRLEALAPEGSWVLVDFAPSGTLDYDDVLPFDVWHCATGDGCVARLRLMHDQGGLGANAAFGRGTIHVCTEDYAQREGRRHCGARELERVSGGLDDDDIHLASTSSRAAEQFVDPLYEGVFVWRGDAWSRLIWGFHDFKHAEADSPPTGDAATELAGMFFDYQWTPDEEISVALGVPGNANWKAYSMDIGACSFFIPWEWEHRLKDASYTDGFGFVLGDRGLAERFLDEIIDTAEPQLTHEVNALLWIDGTLGVIPNENASPEFHYRLSEGAGEPQICFKQYFHASSEISTRPDHWYRFDQAIGAFFLELLPFVGQCGFKNVSFRYCGTPDIVDGEGTFTIDPTSVRIEHQGYPWGKVLCNNQFVPRLLDGFRATFEPGGEGTTQIEDGIAVLVSSLSAVLGLEVRRIEMSPRGVYLVTAESTLDPQYGAGDCRPDLDRIPPFEGASRATETYIEYGARGVTRY